MHNFFVSSLGDFAKAVAMGNRAYCWGSWCYWACPCDSIFIVRIKGSAMCFRMDAALKQARVKELDAQESQKQDEREESE